DVVVHLVADDLVAAGVGDHAFGDARLLLDAGLAQLPGLHARAVRGRGDDHHQALFRVDDARGISGFPTARARHRAVLVDVLLSPADVGADQIFLCDHRFPLVQAAMRPPASLTILPQRCASASSCVTSTSVVPASALSSNSRSMMPAPVAASRLPVGSSASRSLGLTTKARASATRCCSPPESTFG